MRRTILVVQLCLVAIALWSIGSQLALFPFPSPLAQVFLSPTKRWPMEKVQEWIESGNVDKGFLEFFNRDPERIIPAGNNFVSPADGRLKGIFHRDGIDYFTVGLSYWDVHVVRSPFAGTVKSIESEGLSIYKGVSETEDFAYLKGKASPVQQIVTVENEFGTFKVRLITSYWASRIKVWAIPGQRVKKGERIGRILLGSSVVVDFQKGFSFRNSPGDRMVAGETVIVDLGQQE